uniref:Polygalacturonase n=1 Tax=Aegilops tauschii TaxID=37682 RepID=M8AXF3_AEGTA
MGRGRRRGMRAVPLSFLVLVLVLMAVARVAAAVERIDVADGVNFGGGEGGDEAFKKRFLKLWTDGGGGDEEDHLRWYGDDDDDYGDIYDDKKVEEMVKEEEEEGEDGIMLGATRCPNPNKKKKKKRNVVKVDSYGAVGDGCADDTEVLEVRLLGRFGLKPYQTLLCSEGQRLCCAGLRFSTIALELNENDLLVHRKTWQSCSKTCTAIDLSCLAGPISVASEPRVILVPRQLVPADRADAVDPEQPEDAAPVERAFAKAWEKACSLKDAVLVVTKGRRYKIGPSRFMGPCKERLVVLMHGTIVAPEEPSEWDPKSPRLWLLFGGLVGARIQGGGVIDGAGYVRNVRFSNVLVEAVDHPIIIDQFYCDSRTPCANQTTNVAVSNVAYRNISGTSTRDEAIKFACSDAVPCSDIVLSNINLLGDDGDEVQAVCNCAMGLGYDPVPRRRDCLRNNARGGGGRLDYKHV